MQYPKLFITHHPNEGKKSKFEQFLYKILGVKTGMPDLLIFTPSKGFGGLAIELKVDGKKPTAVQIECMADLRKCNWLVVVCWSIDEYIKTVNDYIKVI